MDESMNPSSPQENVPSGEKQTVRFSGRDWITLLIALGLAVLWFSIFGFEVLLRGATAPAGLGTALYVLALFAAVLFRLGRRAVWTRTTVLLLAACVLLAVNCFVYANAWTALINCFVLLGTGAMEIFALSGKLGAAVSDVRAVGRTVALSFRALFVNMGKPFRALGSLYRGDRKRIGYIAAGVVCTVPVLILVIYLLSTADAVFGSLFSRLSDWLNGLSALSLWRVVRAAVLGLMLFSALYFLTQDAPAAQNVRKERGCVSAAPFITALTLLDLVYAVFVAIQFAFLFGGRQTAAMSGGYAEYARSGFFQLVAVAVINLAAVLVTSVAVRPEGGGKTAVRTLSSLLLAFTAVILASALYRMCLYISAYGLSILRALTLWGMAFIAVLLIAAGIKVFRPQTKFWPVFLAAGLAGWLVFSYINIDARIAKHNVNAYLSGELDEIDVDYLTQNLSPESLPYIKKLAAEAPELRDDYGLDLNSAAREIERRLSDSLNWRDVTLTAIRFSSRREYIKKY